MDRKLLFFPLIATVLSFFPFLDAHPQDQRLLDIDEIQVVAPYEPTISGAFKINVNPAMDDTVQVEMDFDYGVEAIGMATRYESEPLSPARMRGEPLSRLYRGHVRLGYGSYQTPYLEAHYNTLRSNEYALGVRAKHLSSGDEIDRVPHSIFSRNMVNAYGTRFYRNTALSADLLYRRRVIHYYGQPVWESIAHKSVGEEDNGAPGAGDVRQRYELLSSALELGNSTLAGQGVQYNAGVQHHWLSDRYDGSEHHVRVHGEMNGQVGADPFGLVDSQRFFMEADASYFFLNNRRDTLHLGVISVRPQLHSSVDRLDIHLGANISVEDADGDFHLRGYPLAGLQLEIIPGSLLAKMEVSGGLKQQSWYALSAENPFADPAPLTAISNIRSDFHAGVFGEIGGRLSYNIMLRNRVIDNHPFFLLQLAAEGGSEEDDADVPGSVLPYHDHAFAVLYDDIRVLHLKAELSSRFGKRFSLRLRGEFHDYTLDQQTQAWHHPAFLLGAHARYNIQDKIILTADLFGRGKTYGGAIQPGSETAIGETLHDFIADLNFGVEYRYNRRLSVFLNFSNVGGEDYQRWLHYPTQGFSFLGGIAYSF